MKKIGTIAALLFTCSLNAQVQWKYEAKKIDDKTFELRMEATVQDSWHLYSQSTPDGGPVPTTIQFTANPVIVLEGKAKELGTLVQKKEETFGIDVKYFEKKVVFAQKLKLKAKIKTNVQGNIRYMLCNDHECLPPKTEQFSVVLK